ncbi:unnamed protein product [Staurois parvus]|uniref:Uncharacterized protein n=1 Tax=Staurois parvus TaxID=386267 RepID=A0ABN9ES53_9NEOB|nr:unnamed protein product [Staurois parvus]
MSQKTTGREDTFRFRSPRRSDRKWEQVPVKFVYPLRPPKVSILNGERGNNP